MADFEGRYQVSIFIVNGRYFGIDVDSRLRQEGLISKRTVQNRSLDLERVDLIMKVVEIMGKLI